jgi:hypothetical protein
MKRKKYIAVSILVIFAVWFLGVDLSWFVYDCPDCGYGKDVVQHRIFTIPVRETVRETPSITQYVAADLGVPCGHQHSTSWHKHKWWGLLVCKSPCINGTYRIAGDDSWYNRQASAKIVALAATDSSIKDDFSQIVLVNHDFSFVRTVLDRAGVDRTQ